MPIRILVIDDDPEIRELLSIFLTMEEYEVHSAENGMGGLALFREFAFDLVILDLGLPDMGGEQLCRIIRKESRTPILILSAKDSVSDKVICLEYGADDYVTKPFENLEMLARIKAILRRAADGADCDRDPESCETLFLDDLEIDRKERVVRRNGEVIDLTPKEFEILAYMAANRGELLARDRVITDLWGKNTLYRWSRSLDVHIQHIRQKVERNPKNPELIQTVSGVGYKVKG